MSTMSLREKAEKIIECPECGGFNPFGFLDEPPETCGQCGANLNPTDPLERESEK